MPGETTEDSIIIQIISKDDSTHGFRRSLSMPDLHVPTVTVQKVMAVARTVLMMHSILPTVFLQKQLPARLMRGLNFINGDIGELFHTWHTSRLTPIHTLPLKS
jgi:hypothetical protein